jgi:hypothetical protein
MKYGNGVRNPREIIEGSGFKNLLGLFEPIDGFAHFTGNAAPI